MTDVLPMRILIADDDRSARFLLKKSAEPYGEVNTASDGGQAMDQLQAAYEAVPFDVCLLDVMMPEVDGYSLLRHIRAEDAVRGRHTVVILTTALVDFDNDQSGNARRADFLVQKPFRRQALIDIFEKVFHIRPQAPADLR